MKILQKIIELLREEEASTTDLKERMVLNKAEVALRALNLKRKVDLLKSPEEISQEFRDGVMKNFNNEIPE